MVKINGKNTVRTKAAEKVGANCWALLAEEFQVLRKSSALFHVALIINIVTVRAMIYESHRVDQQLHPPQRGCKN